MGEASVFLERLVQGPYLLVVVAAVMAILGSLVGVFTFCVKRKRADDAVGKRKKTDARMPDDRTEREPSAEDRTTVATTTEERTHSEAGSGANGVHPVISKNNEQIPPLIDQSEEEEEAERDREPLGVHGDEETPPIKEEGEERVGERGVEDVPMASTELETASEATPDGHPSGGSLDHTHEASLVNETEGGVEEVAMVNGGDEVAMVNGGDEVAMVNGEVDGGESVAMVNGGTHKKSRWSFPPELEDFDLMLTEIDPSELEHIFVDDRMVEIYLEVEPDSPGLGISIVGGNGSPSGDLPIVIKRVLPNSLAERDGRLKTGDELVAVNDTLLVGVAKDVAIETLSNLSGSVRLLVLQDD